MRIRDLSGFQQPFVGFLVGKIALPDKCSASGISDLDQICRVCQVFFRGESLPEERRLRIVPFGPCMMLATEASLDRLAWGLRVKVRVQHPEVKPRKDRQGWPWIFRYRSDEIQPDGSVKTLRRYQAIGPSKGEGAITRKKP